MTEDVEQLNYLLQNLVDNALEAISSNKYQDHMKSGGGGGKDGFESKISQTNHLSPLKMHCASLTKKIVSGNYHPSRSEQSLLDDALLRDTLCQLLYRTYFAGTHFFGVLENEERVLNTIFETIQSQGKVFGNQTIYIIIIHSFIHTRTLGGCTALAFDNCRGSFQTNESALGRSCRAGTRSGYQTGPPSQIASLSSKIHICTATRYNKRDEHSST